MSVKTHHTPIGTMNKEQTKSVTSHGGNSVFHVAMPTPSCKDCLEGLQDIGQFAEKLKQLCGAGTHAADKISSLLVATSYREIAGQFLVLQQHIESAMGGMVSQIKTELEACIKLLNRDEFGDGGKGDEDVNGQGHKSEDIQVLTMGFVLMLQLQQQFFITATEKLACFSQSHALNNTNGLTIDTKLQPQSPRATNPSTGHQVAGRAASDPECHGRRSPGKFDKTESESSSKPWYADSEKYNKGAGSSQDVNKFPSTNMTTKSAGQNICHAKSELDCVQRAGGRHNNPDIQLPNGMKFADAKSPGSIVSEEEIDVVIDMLSRATKYSAPSGGDQAELAVAPNIHASVLTKGGAVMSQGGISRAPGSQLPSNHHHLVNTTTGSGGDHGYSNRAAQHRQSDGFIMESHMNNETKMNTWPFRPRQKDASPSWQGVDFSQSSLYNPHGVSDAMAYQDAVFGYNPAGSFKPGLIPYINPGGPWGAPPDGPTSKAWPMFSNSVEGEAATRQWSAQADSSSCSDESSSNGEVQWMMGINLMDAMKKRRHSSGGEETAASCGLPTNINKSVDSLMESKSTNTWPPKHPWGKPVDGQSITESGDGSHMKGAHKPLMPQWSDPLATRPLTVWDSGTGLTGSLSQQSFGNLSAGAPEYNPALTVNTQDEEKRF